MENKIKVTVEYEVPKTSKFDALMAEYEAAKKYADETVAYYKPLADVAEDVKVDAILEQLETIKMYAKQISAITNESVWISCWIGAYRFDVVYRMKEANPYEITYGGGAFTKDGIKLRCYRDKYFEGNNLIGRWEELKAYERLEGVACGLLQEAINKQKNRANHETNRLYNITKGGN